MEGGREDVIKIDEGKKIEKGREGWRNEEEEGDNEGEGDCNGKRTEIIRRGEKEEIKIESKIDYGKNWTTQCNIL